jgi:hypothetical protein
MISAATTPQEELNAELAEIAQYSIGILRVLRELCVASAIPMM